MENSGEQPKFEVKTVVEQKPFESEAVRGFFNKWCEVNDSIKPEFVDRDEWNKQKEQGILQKRVDGKSTLFIPKDLQLWEMIGVIEVVDNNTFGNDPEMSQKAKEKIIALGQNLENAGIFIAKRVDGITQGKEIAEALAVEFCEYGRALKSEQREEGLVSIKEIAQKELTPEEMEKAEQFLAGEKLYNSRHKRAERKAKNTGLSLDLAYEAERQDTLNQFFRVANKAFELQGREELRRVKRGIQPWKDDTPIHNAFLKRINKFLKQEIELPKQELTTSFFRRGMELLRKNMPFDTLGWFAKSYLHLENGEKTLREALQIDKLKAELEEVRATQDVSKISLKEKEIAYKIQRVVGNFTYNEGVSNPSEILANQFMNCVGASILGGSLMKEVGLNYLVVDVPIHSILFLVTSDGNIVWQDMLDNDGILNKSLQDDMIKGEKDDGSALTVADIVAFSKNPTLEGLMFRLDDEEFHSKQPWVKEGQVRIPYVTVFEHEYGQKIQVLGNLGNALRALGRNEEAVEVYKQVVDLDPKSFGSYNGLSESLIALGRNEEAVDVCRRRIRIYPEEIYSYVSLGRALRALGRNEEAVEVYRKGIEIKPGNSDLYLGLGNALRLLGRNEEAVESYRKGVNLDPKETPFYNHLGNSLRDLSRYEEAAEVYLEGINISSELNYLYYNLGIALRALGRNEEALEAYQKFVDLVDKDKYASYIAKAEKIIDTLKK